MKSLLVLWVAGLVILTGCTSTGSTVRREDHFGVLVMAHGGSKQWNQAVESAVKPLESRYPIEIAFGMADAGSLQDAARRLESQGVRHVAVVRLFVSGESFKDRTEQILGIKPGAPPAPVTQPQAMHHGNGEHEMAFWKISTDATFALSDDGLLDAPEMGDVLAHRAGALSRHPQLEDVLILAHGPGDDAENARWLAKLEARADTVRNSRPFRRVNVETLREDWPERRTEAETRIRAFVERAKHEHGTAIVIPFRVEGFGPYADVLHSLDYVSDGVGLLPDPKITQWIARQAQALRAGPLSASTDSNRQAP